MRREVDSPSLLLSARLPSAFSPSFRCKELGVAHTLVARGVRCSEVRAGWWSSGGLTVQQPVPLLEESYCLSNSAAAGGGLLFIKHCSFPQAPLLPTYLPLSSLVSHCPPDSWWHQLRASSCWRTLQDLYCFWFV
mmetsp:Transcript_77429/g.116395  ORF Transcript_77429/g.116395 Transcript_77429/m.116395 type:complete len:135 (-) Transcript_77429:13-417(-)